MSKLVKFVRWWEYWSDRIRIAGTAYCPSAIRCPGIGLGCVDGSVMDEVR